MSKKYINADALLNHLYSHQDEQPDVAKVIAEFDAADVRENVRGGWVHRHYITKSGRTFDTVYCIECGEEYSYDAETGVKAEDYNFCPNCGADNRPKTTSAEMRGKEHTAEKK